MPDSADSIVVAIARIRARVSLMLTQRSLEDFIVAMGRDPRLHEVARHVANLLDFVIRSEMTLDTCDAPAAAAISAEISSQLAALDYKTTLATRLLETGEPLEKVEVN